MSSSASANIRPEHSTNFSLGTGRPSSSEKLPSRGLHRTETQSPTVPLEHRITHTRTSKDGHHSGSGCIDQECPGPRSKSNVRPMDFGDRSSIGYCQRLRAAAKTFGRRTHPGLAQPQSSFGQRLRGDHREHKNMDDDRQRQAHDPKNGKASVNLLDNESNS